MDTYSIFDAFDDEPQASSGFDAERSEFGKSATADYSEVNESVNEPAYDWVEPPIEPSREDFEMNWEGILAAEQGTPTEFYAEATVEEQVDISPFLAGEALNASEQSDVSAAAPQELVSTWTGPELKFGSWNKEVSVNENSSDILQEETNSFPVLATNEEQTTELSTDLMSEAPTEKIELSEITSSNTIEAIAETPELSFLELPFESQALFREDTKIEMTSTANEESTLENAFAPLAELTIESQEEQINASTVQAQTDINHTESHIIQPIEAMKFDLPEQSSIIKVIGVGGGGSNAVNHMYEQGIRGVDFVVCNTDKQALDMSPVPFKIVLGAALTEGRGAGSLPEVGRNAAIENIEEIRSLLANNTKMCFITAGMGGGTGTGAAPIIAGIARELGILTVAIVTVPFSFEGKKRRQQAEDGLEQLKQNVDTLLVICNDKLREMYGNLKLSDAFSHADDVLTTAAKSIAEIISLTQQINVDFADVCTVMRNSGVAIMGSANASGENRATRAVEMALNSPLLNDNNITGARYVLLNIISGATEITMDELGEITDYIQEAAGQTAEIIKGYGVDETLGDSVNVTIIATGFNISNPIAYEYSKKPEETKVVLNLSETKLETPLPVVEAKNETLNPLEPFLVKKEETQAEEIEQRYAPELKSAPEQTQQTIVFEITNSDAQTPVAETASNDAGSNTIEEPFLVVREESVEETQPVQAKAEVKKVETEEQMRKAQERILKLRELSLKLKTSQGLNELENEPAYKRRNIQLDNVPHSSESQVSRFTLTETDDKKVEIRPNNSFLHDNVD